MSLVEAGSAFGTSVRSVPLPTMVSPHTLPATARTVRPAESVQKVSEPMSSGFSATVNVPAEALTTKSPPPPLAPPASTSVEPEATLMRVCPMRVSGPLQTLLPPLLWTE